MKTNIYIYIFNNIFVGDMAGSFYPIYYLICLIFQRLEWPNLKPKKEKIWNLLGEDLYGFNSLHKKFQRDNALGIGMQVVNVHDLHDV